MFIVVVVAVLLLLAVDVFIVVSAVDVSIGAADGVVDESSVSFL